MKLGQATVLLATFALAFSVTAGEATKSGLAIAVVDDSGDGETRIELDGDDFGFDLHEMQVGENRSIVDKSGRTVLVTREEEGLRFEVDGKTIRVPAHGDYHRGVVSVDGNSVENVDVHVVRDHTTATAFRADDVMIISAKPVDEATRQSIQSLLESAGHGSEVRFVDRESRHGSSHAVKIIRTESD